MAIKYQIIPVTPFEQNCSLLWCDETKQAAVVDPGGDIAYVDFLVPGFLVSVILWSGMSAASGVVMTASSVPAASPDSTRIRSCSYSCDAVTL